MLVLLCGWMNASRAEAGKVIFVAGAATATSADGSVVSVRPGLLVETGQTLETGDGKVQIRFTDNGMVALPPHSVFRVDQYQYQGTTDGSERGFFSLVKGGLRVVSGVIGKQHRQNYKVNTPSATVGIRGTHYQLRYCDGDCLKGGGRLEKNGLYASVSRGAINLANDAGNLDVGAGKVAYVADRMTAPQRIQHMPQVLAMGDKAQQDSEDNAAEGRAEAGVEQSEDAMRALAGLTSVTENLAGMREEGEGFLSGTGGYQAGENVFKVDGRYVVANLNDIEGGAASDYSRSSALGTLAEIEKNVAAYVDGTGAIRVVTNAEGSASNNTTAISDVYQDGELFLARWSGPGQVGGAMNAPLQGNQSVHWLLVKPYESPLPTSGSATFDMVAATRPTSSDPASAVGMLNSAVVTVNFGGTGLYGGKPYAHYDLTANVFHATGDAGIDVIGDFETGNHGTTPGTVTGAMCTATCQAYVHGLFAGSGVARGGITVPSSLGLLYEIRNGTTSAYHGAAGLKLR